MRVSDKGDERPPEIRLLEAQIEKALDRRFPPGDGGGIGDLHVRVSRIETQMVDVVARLDRIETKLDTKASAVDVAEIKGRVSQIPNFVQVAALVFAIFGASFVLIRFATPT
jgi:hypothetical protein